MNCINVKEIVFSLIRPSIIQCYVVMLLYKWVCVIPLLHTIKIMLSKCAAALLDGPQKLNLSAVFIQIHSNTLSKC